MKKIVTPHLGIELTQKCNLNCSHCFRGDSKNVSISKEIIEKIFDEVKYVQTLDLSGGEVFLGYEELKMVLQIAKEKGTIIERCSMLTNGTVYDQRMYDLLDEYFGRKYQVGISDDDFHVKSIKRIYAKNTINSKNPDLQPLTIEDVKNNMWRHLENSHTIGFKRVSNHLIKNGRAVNMPTPQKEFEAMGYYYSLHPKGGVLAGPVIFVGADGYISDINSEIEKRDEQSIGNIKDSLISDCIINGGIEIEYESVETFLEKMNQREIEFATHQGDHWIFENRRMKETEYIPDEKFDEEVRRVPELINGLIDAVKEGKAIEYLNSIDFSNYSHDISQIEHENYYEDMEK